ncbi:MAG: hypothetical protein ACPGVU_11515, partial [Limisphaerales bacterium]
MMGIRQLLPALLLCLVTASAAKTNEVAFDQTMYFRNGDSLRGRLVSIDRTNGIAWNRPDLKKPVRFRGTNLTEIFLTSRPATAPTNKQGLAVIQLVGGDELVANLISITNDKVTLESADTGRLVIPRSQVAGLLPRPQDDRVIFDRILGTNDWTHGDMSAVPGVTLGRWEYHNGSLLSASAASIARNFDLPNDIRMDFDVYWHNLYGVAIALHTDSLEPISLNARDEEPDFAPFYSMLLRNSTVELRVVPKEGPIRGLGQLVLPVPRNTNHATFSIFASEKRKSVSLMANGRLVREWIDPMGWSAGGKGLRFVHQGYGNMRIANLRITRWDGARMVPQTISPHPEVDVAMVADGQTRGGRITGFTNDTFYFNTGNQEMAVPFAELSHVTFALRKRKPMNLGTNHVRVFFNGRGRLSGHLKSWSEKQTRLEIPGLGEVSLSSNALGRIQF